MKIVLIGPGILPIPPKGWGATESIIWDYKTELEKLQHQVFIINEPNLSEIIEQVNFISPDFVHLHYGRYLDIFPYIDCPHKAVTSHGGYVQQPKKFLEYSGSNLGTMVKFFELFKTTNPLIFCLSPEIKKVYMDYGNIREERLIVLPNGVRSNLFRFDEHCRLPDKSIYLGRIEGRKRQYLFQNYGNGLDFAGNYHDNRFNINSSAYLGEWNREIVYENLTNYANLVLLSDGEAHALVCIEAMISGLGLVISEFATANLDLSRDFIDVIPETRIRDRDFVINTIQNNRRKSVNLRKEIHQYALDNFDLEKICKQYSNIIQTQVNSSVN